MKRPIKTRNYIAIAAQFRQAGAHGGSAKQKNRRDRKAVRHELRAERC